MLKRIEITIYEDDNSQTIISLSFEKSQKLIRFLNSEKIKEPKKFLKKSNYFNIRDKAWEILLECNTKSLPIHLYPITQQYGWITLEYKKDAELIKSIDGKGMRFRCEAFLIKIAMPGELERYIICYDGSLPKTRIRWNIAHEIGHLILNHLEYTGKEYEKEANQFAARILMPVGILYLLNVKNPQQIAHFCNVSYMAAQNRFKRLETLIFRKKFFTHPLECKLRENFCKYIQQNKIY